MGASGDGDAWSGDATGGTLAGNLAIIRGDTQEALRVRRFIRLLRERGFDGAALEDLLSRGDVNEIANFANSSRGELRQYERALGVAEIAELLGVTRQRVHQLRQADGFPEPASQLAIGPVWESADVERWARETG